MRKLIVTLAVALLWICAPSNAFSQNVLWWFCNLQPLTKPNLMYFTAVFGPASDDQLSSDGTANRKWEADFMHYVSSKYGDGGRGGCEHFGTAAQAEAELKRQEGNVTASIGNGRFIGTGWRPALTP